MTPPARGTSLWSSPEDWGWNANFTPSNLAKVAVTSLGLLLRERKWINRRVETIHLIDKRRLRLQVSVDFRLPEKLPGAIKLGPEPTYFVPLMFLSRQADVCYFDVRDESAASIPLLTAEDNGLLTGHILMASALTVLRRERERLPAAERKGFEISSDAKAYLQGIATRPKDSQAFLRFVLDRHDTTLYPDRRVPEALLDDRDFRRLLTLAATGSAIHVPLVTAPGRRRIIKLSWEQQWSTEDLKDSFGKRRGRRVAMRVADAMGWRPYSPWLMRPYMGGGAGHHIQISVPAHVAMTEAGITGVDPADVLEYEAGVLESSPERRDRTYLVADQPRFTQSAHLYLEHSQDARLGLLWIRLRASRRGFLPGAFLTALYVTLLLTLYWRNAHDIRPERETAAAVLLLIPALIASWLVHPTEHEMARRLMRFARWVTTFVAALPLLAASLLVAVSDPDPPAFVSFLVGAPRHADWKLETGWLVLAGAAMVSTILLGLSWLYPRPQAIHERRPPSEYPPPVDTSL